jgi:hypothetical protein
MLRLARTEPRYVDLLVSFATSACGKENQHRQEERIPSKPDFAKMHGAVRRDQNHGGVPAIG